MHKYFYIIAIAILLLCVSCRNTAQTSHAPKSDTTEAMQILFDSTISLPRLADIPRLSLNNPFRDTAIVVKDSFIFRNLPTNYKLKFLTIDSICSLANKYERNTEFPNFLEFGFEKITDSTFAAYVRNFRMQRNSDCLFALNDGCFKYISFKKVGKRITSKVEQTLYD